MITVERPIHPSVVTLTVNRPEKRNALNAAVALALTEAFVEAENDPTVRAVVLTGAGTTFSSGADLAALSALATATFEENLQDSRVLAGLFETIYTSNKPVIARVNGHAIAGGCGLAAVCDFAIATSKSKLGFTEVKIGFVPAIISVYLLERLPESVLRPAFLTGALFSAHEALAMGLLHQVVEAERLDEAVSGLAQTLVRDASGHAQASTKQLLRERHAQAHGPALEVAIRRNAEARGTESCRAGVTAFLEKNAFPWQQKWETNA
ncbi:MAG: methylglutaconyl-CoA hydratase [Rhodothermales bacterium]|jgi:methylglutaconyl-CoA hydratase